MHVYAFGSICRGEIDPFSDLDLLALVKGRDDRLSPNKFSIYSYQKISTLWAKGSAFAWHLHLESRLLFASDNFDFLEGLGSPARYSGTVEDCEKFRGVFEEAVASLMLSRDSEIFDLSSMFLSIRNIATCFSLGVLNQPVFSRHAGRLIEGFPLPVSAENYRTLERSRILCTRADGGIVSRSEANAVLEQVGDVKAWMDRMVTKAREHERVQQ